MKFIILRKIYIFGIFPILLCTLREFNDAGLITEKKIKSRVRRYGSYPDYEAYLDVDIDGINQSYLINRWCYTHLNFQDKPVAFKIDNPQPLLENPF